MRPVRWLPRLRRSSIELGDDPGTQGSRGHRLGVGSRGVRAGSRSPSARLELAQVDDGSFPETLEELSRIELRRVASQLRFAGSRTVHYYRVDGLRQVSPDGATGRAGTVSSAGAYGPEIRTAVRDHDRVYVVCDVPDTGSQTQLTLSDGDRTTTVATFEPRTPVLAVRAPDTETADATARAAVDFLGLDDASRISFLDGGFRGRFEEACVAGYSSLRLRTAGDRGASTEIVIRPAESGSGRHADVRTDAVVSDLLRRNDTELEEATGVAAIAGDVRPPSSGERFRPRVAIGFPDGRVRFEQFVPEQVLLELDDIVRDSL
ncbi:hypothetical protein [Halorubrum lipolyticum]|uniref:hypothetical protein n=1 Tax=Halorubrum lipolyticum TaxID=368624 RepID=UPI0011C91F46|nr:hypothetical protein [Halorubrum lipolyticum]